MDETRLRAVKAGIKLYELDNQWDVDTIADLERYLSQMRLRKASFDSQ